MTLVASLASSASEQESKESNPRLKNSEKCLRYYYRHREELREKRRQKLMEDPEYVAKQEAKQAKEAEKERKRMEREAMKHAKAKKEVEVKAEREERRRLKAMKLGIAV